MTSKQAEELGYLVCEIAAEIFDRCEAPNDFCIQHVGVFGGTNRLIFSPKSGWRIDTNYCTPRFRAKWNEIKSEYCQVTTNHCRNNA